MEEVEGDSKVALVIAIAILTFADGASRILAGTYRVPGNVTSTQMAAVIGDLDEMLSELDDEDLGDTEHEASMRILSLNCEAMDGELRRLLEEMPVPECGSTWEGFNLALRNGHNEDEVKKLKEKLGECYKQILPLIVLMIT
jgi:hypothetical protein